MGIFVAALVLIDVVLFGVVAALPFARDLAPLVPNEEHLTEETGVSYIPVASCTECIIILNRF